MITANPYMPIPAKLIDVIDETPTIKTLILEPDEPMPFRAGQFVQLTLPGVGEAPFTPSSSPLDPDRIAVTILNAGAVTEGFHECRPGRTLGMRGPFGKGFPIEELEGQDVLVVGGGVGLAPLRALVLALLANMKPIKRMSIKYGARCVEELLYRDQYDVWAEHEKVDFACTIDHPQAGWDGHTGVVTTLLKDLDVEKPNTHAFVCGPSVMLKFATFTLIDEGLSPEQICLSMNRRMSCGMGKCGRCNIGPLYLCKDGPDISYAKVKDYPNVF